MCVGKFSEDGLWYRAEVIGIRASKAEAGTESPPLLKLKFIDYGNQEEMPLTPVSGRKTLDFILSLGFVRIAPANLSFIHSRSVTRPMFARSSGGD